MILTLALVILTGVILTTLTYKNKKLCGYIAFISVLIINIIILKIVFKVFSSETPLTASFPLFSIPSIGASLLVSVDKLSAIFLALIGLVSLIATLYSIDYMEIYKKESLVRFYPILLLFIGGMLGVVCVFDLFFFFVVWEFMTLASYFLVIYEKEDPVALKAGFKYFLMTHIATALMFIAGLILQSYTGSFSFTAISEAINTVSFSNPVLLHIILALFFIGFATKAGVYPFGVWLPDAHPAAPSGISAILSGIMIKMGIYGILRIFLYILPSTSSHSLIWGEIIATFGVASALIGSFSALIQKDSKRLLAFSSIGQIGYIVLAIGIGISLLKNYPVIATISVIAGLFHMINHALFKSLLFLNAGSILYKTNTRDLNKLGGLWSAMPYTTATAVIASLSISGFPPFNGFVSKWLIYQVSILGGRGMPLYYIFGIIAIFASALTVAYLLKFLSTAFLGDLPEKMEVSLKEVTLNMNIAQYILAFLCILLGLFPLVPLSLIYLSLSGSQLGSHLLQFSYLFGNGRNGVNVLLNGNPVGIWRPLFMFFIFLICLLLVYLISKSCGSKKRAVPVWYCGEEYPVDIVRYRASSFYLPVAEVFERWFLLFPPVKGVEKPETIYKILDFDKIFYYPFFNFVVNLTERIRKIHAGIPQIYMLWQIAGIFLAILILFSFVR